MGWKSVFLISTPLPYVRPQGCQNIMYQIFRQPLLCAMEERNSKDSLDVALMAAATGGDAAEVSRLLREDADACFQDNNGKSVLMAAAGGGHADVVCLLLDAGAPWNAFDKAGRCAGEYASDGGHTVAANALLEAGIRAELLLGALERAVGRSQEVKSSASYLQQHLEYKQGGDGADVLMDSEDKAVMMAWEGPLMEAHAHAICSRGGDVLNVGFGLGVIDEAIQRRAASSEDPSTSIKSHTIIEAHPDVYARMCAAGWDTKPGVTVVFGRWQDVVGKLGQYDGIFFDTYSEFYDDLREFHGHLPQLLKRGGIYSYFNGLAADNPFFHAVYCELCRREVAHLGLDTHFVSLPINVADPAVWKSVRNKYWQLDTYFLPVCEWRDEGPPAGVQSGGASSHG